MTLRGLYDLGLSNGVYMYLHAHSGVQWPRIEYLTGRTALQVLQVPGIGQMRLAHIERVLKRHNLALRKGAA